MSTKANWSDFGMALLLELAKRNNVDDATAIAAVQAIKDPQEAMDAVLTSPEVKTAVVNTAADLIEKTDGNILSGIFNFIGSIFSKK